MVRTIALVLAILVHGLALALAHYGFAIVIPRRRGRRLTVHLGVLLVERGACFVDVVGEAVEGPTDEVGEAVEVLADEVAVEGLIVEVAVEGLDDVLAGVPEITAASAGVGACRGVVCSRAVSLHGGVGGVGGVAGAAIMRLRRSQ